jgi:hypothetical protein
VVDLISSGEDSDNNSGDNSGNNSGDDSEDHEASSETITYSLINCSNASISICCWKLLHMTLIGFGLNSTNSRNRLKRSRQVLKPVRVEQLSCKVQLL